MKCNKCFNEIPDGNSFCTSCGAKADADGSPQAKLCPNCGAQINSKGYFCVKCGTKTAEQNEPKHIDNAAKSKNMTQGESKRKWSLKSKLVIGAVIFLIAVTAGAICGFIAATDKWGLEELFSKSDIAWLDYSWPDQEIEPEIFEVDEKAEKVTAPDNTDPAETADAVREEPASADSDYLSGKWNGMLFGEEQVKLTFEFYDGNKLTVTTLSNNSLQTYDYIYNDKTMIISIIDNENGNQDEQDSDNNEELENGYENEEELQGGYEDEELENGYENGEEIQGGNEDETVNDEAETDMVFWYVKPISQDKLCLYTQHIKDWNSEEYGLDYVFAPIGLAFNTDSGFLLTRSF